MKRKSTQPLASNKREKSSQLTDILKFTHKNDAQITEVYEAQIAVPQGTLVDIPSLYSCLDWDVTVQRTNPFLREWMLSFFCDWPVCLFDLLFGYMGLDKYSVWVHWFRNTWAPRNYIQVSVSHPYQSGFQFMVYQKCSGEEYFQCNNVKTETTLTKIKDLAKSTNDEIMEMFTTLTNYLCQNKWLENCKVVTKEGKNVVLVNVS